MDTIQVFKEIMETQTEMALATCMENQPNVRIVNFYFDSATNTLFFTSFKDNQKVKEFEINQNVSFTTIPHKGNKHVRAKGIIQKSSRTIFDMADFFIKKIPDYKDIIEQAGQFLILYEIKFDNAVVTIDFRNIDTIQLI